MTFQLHDSFPVMRRAEMERLLNEPRNSLQRRKLEAWLDRGYGHCFLKDRLVAEVVENVLLEGDGRDYRMQSWVIMPNHVHLVVEVWSVPLGLLVNRWKGRSARDANKLLTRCGSFWQEDYRDTLIRDEAHLNRAIHYTEQNPVKAHLVKVSPSWPWSSARLRDGYNRLPWQRDTGQAP